MAVEAYLPAADDLNALALHLAEECNEVALAVHKLVRFGSENNHPADQHQVTNWETLMSEYTDVLRAYSRLCACYYGTKSALP